MTNPPITETPVTRELSARGIPFRLFSHPGPVRTLEQAAEERGQQPGQVIRSILFRLADDQFVLALAAGPEQISWGRLRAHLGVTRMTMATPEEVLQQTGYPTGAVGPFGLPAPLRMLADDSVFAPDEISLGSGVRNTTVILSSADLRRALPQVEVGCFVGCDDE